MVYVAIEIQRLFGLHDAEPEEWVFQEIEGTHELCAVCIQLCFCQVYCLHAPRLVLVYELLYAGVVCPEVYEQFRVIIHHLGNRFLQLLFRHTFRHLRAHGYII